MELDGETRAFGGAQLGEVADMAGPVEFAASSLDQPPQGAVPEEEGQQGEGKKADDRQKPARRPPRGALQDDEVVGRTRNEEEAPDAREDVVGPPVVRLEETAARHGERAVERDAVRCGRIRAEVDEDLASVAVEDHSRFAVAFGGRAADDAREAEEPSVVVRMPRGECVQRLFRVVFRRARRAEPGVGEVDSEEVRLGEADGDAACAAGGERFAVEELDVDDGVACAPQHQPVAVPGGEDLAGEGSGPETGDLLRRQRGVDRQARCGERVFRRRFDEPDVIRPVDEDEGTGAFSGAVGDAVVGAADADACAGQIVWFRESVARQGDWQRRARISQQQEDVALVNVVLESPEDDALGRYVGEVVLTRVQVGKPHGLCRSDGSGAEDFDGVCRRVGVAAVAQQDVPADRDPVAGAYGSRGGVAVAATSFGVFDDYGTGARAHVLDDAGERDAGKARIVAFCGVGADLSARMEHERQSCQERNHVA